MSKFSLTSARLGLLQPKLSSLAVVICTVVTQDQYLRRPREGRNLLLQTFFHWRGTSVVLQSDESRVLRGSSARSAAVVPRRGECLWGLVSSLFGLTGG